MSIAILRRSSLAALVALMAIASVLIVSGDSSGPMEVLSFATLEATLAYLSITYWKDKNIGLWIAGINALVVSVRAVQFLLLFTPFNDLITHHIITGLAVCEILALCMSEKRLAMDGIIGLARAGLARISGTRASNKDISGDKIP